MQRTTLIVSFLAGVFLVGCSSMRPYEKQTEPFAVTGQAATTTTGIDSMANPAPGTSTGIGAGRAADPNQPPGVETGGTRDKKTEPTSAEQFNVEMQK